MSQRGMPPNYDPYNQPAPGGPQPQQGAPQQQQYPGAPQQQPYQGAPPQQQYPGAPQQQPYQGAPQQQQYPGAPQQQYPGMQQQQYPGMQQQGAPKRNPVLLVIGGLLLVIGLGAGALFLMNFYQYLTVEDRFSGLPSAARQFGVRLVKQSAMSKMTVFGPVAGIFGVGGLVLLVLGMRKK